MKGTRSLFRLVSLALSYMAVATGCGGSGESGDVMPELAGKWYDKNYALAFEITQSGEGYIAAKKLHCTVTLSGNFVYFRYDGYVMGSFYHSIDKNGELTMTLGLGDFKDIQSASPFVKSDATPQGGNVPVELIGKWYAVTTPPSTPNFEITAAGMTAISGAAAHYSVHVSGNNVSVLEGSVLKGTFTYVIRYGEMTVRNGTALCEGLSVLSPFAKKNN
ncbi:MAG: hypothetical protein LBK73_02585 [Treponema sp.]|jgi:hypothetical protein|nr:hypothetical protein [Treponema sp.]